MRSSFTLPSSRKTRVCCVKATSSRPAAHCSNALASSGGVAARNPDENAPKKKGMNQQNRKDMGDLLDSSVAAILKLQSSHVPSDHLSVHPFDRLSGRLCPLRAAHPC